ncbi:hypothetical protein CJ030_MR4G024746 [Morella rubra]|uniref:Uncharacterized protein n=1 Tax=Morella rubra TaxID=262757 RepID=A0A6A1WTJ2_9ROSI|nr:hypothetical protein CJ030_MR4G024746 [Morella rubra]
MGYRRLPEILGCRSIRIVMRMKVLLWLRLRMSLRVRRYAEAMEFDVDADLAMILPLFLPLPEIRPPSSSDTRFTAFEARMLAMHEAQNKFIQDSFTSMQEEQRQFFAEMRTFMARFPPP